MMRSQLMCQPEMLCHGHFDLIFTHPEVLVENKKLSKLLIMPAFKEKVKAIVVDEAHLVVDWYVATYLSRSFCCNRD